MACKDCIGCNDCKCEEIDLSLSSDEVISKYNEKLRVFSDLLCVIRNAQCPSLPDLMAKFGFYVWCLLRDLVKSVTGDVTCIKQRTDTLLDNNRNLCSSQQLIVDKLNEAIKATNSKYEADKALYEIKLREYELKKAEVAQAKQEYEEKLAEYNRLLNEYNTKVSEKQNADSSNAEARRAYEEALVTYRAKLAEYETAMQNYNDAKSRAESSEADYQRALEAYNTKLAKYNVDKAKYDRDYQAYLDSLEAFINYTPTFGTITNVTPEARIVTEADNNLTMMSGTINQDTGEFEFIHDVYVATTTLGHGFLRGKINHYYTANPDGSISVTIQSITLYDYSYRDMGQRPYGTSDTIEFKVFSNSGSLLYASRMHGGYTTFTDNINRTTYINQTFTVQPRTTSAFVKVLQIHDDWEIDTHGYTFIRYTNNNDRLIVDQPPAVLPEPVAPVAPVAPTKVVVEVPTKPRKPSEPKEPTPITVTVPDKPVEPTKVDIEEPTKPTEPEKVTITELTIDCGVNDFEC